MPLELSLLLTMKGWQWKLLFGGVVDDEVGTHAMS